jgi:hypothetical protein
MGVGNVSGTGDSVTCGMGVSVNVGKLVAVGDGNGDSVGRRVVVGGMGVVEAGTTVGLALRGVEGVERNGVVVESEI